MKRILVTGANGFIGSHVVEECQRLGFGVLAGVRSGSNLSNLEHISVPLITLNYSDKGQLSNQLKSELFEYVIHVAGVTMAQTELEYLEGNYDTTDNLIAAVKDKSLEKFVFISSLAARGPGLDSIDDPVSPYGISKLKTEKLLERSQIPYLIVRPTAVYGPRNMEFLPLFKWGSKGIIFSLGSPNRKLSFIHVLDLVRMILNELDNGNKLIHATDGKTYSLKETNELIKQTFDRNNFIIIKIHSKLFERIMSLSGFIVYSIFGKTWKYPPGKVRELIAEDWSVRAEGILIENQHNLKDGFLEMTKFYSQNRWL